jgi:hypothetical protein
VSGSFQGSARPSPLSTLVDSDTRMDDTIRTVGADLLADGALVCDQHVRDLETITLRAKSGMSRCSAAVR